MPRPEWDARVKLAAAKRCIEHLGMGTSVWGHATVRCPDLPDQMLLAPFGESFGQATASNHVLVPLHLEQLLPEQREGVNITAVVLHGSCYGARRDVGAVLHTHSPHATAIAASELHFDSQLIQVRAAAPAS